MSKPWSFHRIKLFELLLFSFWKPWDGISDHVFLSFFDLLFSPFALQIAARAKYSVAYDGTFPDLYLPNFENETVTSTTGGPVEQISSAQLPKKAWNCTCQMHIIHYFFSGIRKISIVPKGMLQVPQQ
jgi:hypothetical protein